MAHGEGGQVNPSDVVAIGPLVLALDRVAALAAILLVLWACDWIVRRHGLGKASLGWWALATGLIAARLGHAAIHWQSFALDPVEVARVWLGGWHWPSGLAAALAVLAARLGRSRALAEAAAVVAALGLGWTAFHANRADQPRLRLPPDLTLQRIDGPPLRLADLRGRSVILNLWASWCPPCRRETPMLSHAAVEEGGPPLVLVNQGEDRATVQRYIAAQSLPAGGFALDPDGTLSALTGSRALPTTLLIDGQGTVIEAHMGEISRVQIDIMIRRAQR